MKQKQIGKTLYVLTTEPYVISDVGDASVIFVHTNFYDEFKALNPSLELTRYNYMLLRKSEPEYYKYINEPDFVDFEFDSSIQNVSSWIDETKSMILQSLHLPDDYTGTVSYTLNGNVLDSSAFTLENAGTYQIDASIPGTSLYEADTASYSIIYQKYKRNTTLSFANATVNSSSFVDETKTMTLQEVSGIPTGQTANYYLDSSLLSSNSITLSNTGNYVVTAKIENSSYYNGASASYTINYSQVKRNAVLSFTNSVVDVSVEDETSYIGQVQNLVGLPTGVTANYYLGNTLLSNGVISINNLEEGENTFTITAKIENNPVYNDAQASYTLSITMEISYENKYLTFEALEDGTFKFTNKVVSYSVDNGKTWTELPANTSTGTIHQGEKILWKGTNNNYNYSLGQIKSSGRYNAIGNIMSLIYGDDFIENNTLNLSCFAFLFANNNKIVETNNLILPATTLANNCYQSMFQGCTSLTTAPELPATTLAKDCYSGMFQGCTSLNYIKAAFSTIVSENSNWVYNVAATGTYIISDPNNNLDTGCIFSVNRVPPGWTVKDENDNLMSYIYQNYEVFNYNGNYNIATGGYANSFKDTFKNIYYLKETPYNIDRKYYHSNVSGILNNVVYWLKENQTSSKLSALYFGEKYLPGHEGTDVIDIPETIQTMDWNSENNNTIKKLIIRSPYLHAGSAPANLNSNIIIYVPNNVVQNYKTSWSSLSNNIIGCDFTKDFLTIRFINDTIDVSTFVGSDYVGTVQEYYGVPSDVSVNLYLDSSLLNSSAYTLTTTGNHIVTAEIVSNSSYYDTSTSYTINYQRVKQDVSIRGITFSSPSGQTFDVDEQVSVPTVTYYTVPGVAQSSVQETYSFDGTNYVSQPPSYYLDTSTAGNYTYYVKFKIPSYDLTYNSQEFVKTWEWTVASSTPVGTLTVIYNVTNPNEETQLFRTGGSSSSSSESGSSESGGTAVLPTSMTIDGVEETPVSTWRFSTASGEHEVVYTFENNTIPPMFLLGNSNIVSILINNLNISDDSADNGVFMGCSFLTDVQIYSSVGIDIGSWAFSSCFSLSNVYLDQIKTINDYAFYNCYNLSSITIDTLIPPYLGNEALNFIPNLKIYVPDESVEDYKGATNWQDYASQIYPISEYGPAESESGESV